MVGEFGEGIWEFGEGGNLESYALIYRRRLLPPLGAVLWCYWLVVTIERFIRGVDVVCFCKMGDKYVNRGRFKLPLGLRIALPVASLYLLSLNVVEGTFKGLNCMESIRKQWALTEKYERKIEEAERKYVERILENENKYVIGGENLDVVVGGRDGN